MQPSIFLIGGFLGSGKTTAIAAACKVFQSQGKKIAVITNDQGHQQVDGDFFKAQSISTQTVADGCFCCRFDQLKDAIEKVVEKEQAAILFAESVGSCTDLVATVVKPLVMEHPDYHILISVFADASFLKAILTQQVSFINEQVQYIYKKQLEEADILVVNKVDLLPVSDLPLIHETLAAEFGGKPIIYQNSNNDVSEWVSLLESMESPSKRKSLSIDYDRYAAGEAALAWLDKKIVFHPEPDTSFEMVTAFCEWFPQRIQEAGYMIGHLKFLLEDGKGWFRKISYTTSGTTDDRVVIPHSTAGIQVLINARIQCTPRQLTRIAEACILDIVEKFHCQVELLEENAFSPAYPTPKYQIRD